MSPSTGPARLLVVDDDEEALRLLAEVLEREGYTVVRALTVEEALRSLDADSDFDAVLTDLRMPGASGLDLLREVRSRDPRSLVFVLTAFGDANAAGEAIRAGAYDFISKPYDLPTLRAAIAQALERRHLAPGPAPAGAGRTELRRPVVVGHSPGIIEVMKTAARVAPSQATVLITGETGTGKELVARAIHTYSDRALRHFVAVNCSALAEGVLESELFGHVKGAFTGAAVPRLGLFREADRGTIFLDEIGDISPGMQSRLLRVLQEREITPVGADIPVKVDVRIVAATHQNLEALVKQGRFRGDLFYRLNVVTVKIPPLRERLQDLPLLAHHFLRDLALSHGREPVALDPEAESLLLGYSLAGERARAAERPGTRHGARGPGRHWTGASPGGSPIGYLRACLRTAFRPGRVPAAPRRSRETPRAGGAEIRGRQPGAGGANPGNFQPNPAPDASALGDLGRLTGPDKLSFFDNLSGQSVC